MTKEYVLKPENEKFAVTEPKDCTLHVTRGGFTAVINIHEATNQYREALDGWGSDHNTLQAALDSACRRILRKSAQPDPKQLCAGMGEFYESLDK